MLQYDEELMQGVSPNLLLANETGFPQPKIGLEGVTISISRLTDVTFVLPEILPIEDINDPFILWKKSFVYFVASESSLIATIA